MSSPAPTAGVLPEGPVGLGKRPRDTDASIADQLAGAQRLIQHLRTENKRLLAENERLRLAPEAPAQIPKQVGQPQFKLLVDYFEVHDNAAIHRHEPPVPCTTAGKSIQVVLKMVDATTEQVVDPPAGLRLAATLHIEGSQMPIQPNEVHWSQRAGNPSASGEAFRGSRFLHLSVGSPDNTFDMLAHTMSLSAFIHVYSTEVQKRKLVIRFAATDPALGITPALTIAVNNMSRTPNSRKTKAPSDLAHIPLLGPPQLHTPMLKAE